MLSYPSHVPQNLSRVALNELGGSGKLVSCLVIRQRENVYGELKFNPLLLELWNDLIEEVEVLDS